MDSGNGLANTGSVPGNNAHRDFVFKSWPIPLFGVLIATSLAIWSGHLVSSVALALGDEQYTYILLILPITCGLIFLDFKSRWPLPARSLDWKAAVASAALIGAALLVNMTIRGRVGLSADIRLAMNMLALVSWWLAAFLVCFGMAAFRRALFSLFFLFWLVPLPEFVLNPLVSFLQRGSAAIAHLIFTAVGMPVAQKGMLLHIPGLTLEVAPECSSIRSSMMLVVTTMVLAHLLLRSPWKKTFIVLAAIPISVAKNGLRIFALGFLATRVDPSFLTGRLHRQGGFVFFLIAMGAIFLLLRILQRGEAEKPGRESGTRS
jgi:exosortase